MEVKNVSNAKLFIWSVLNTFITVLVSSGIGFFFQQKNLRDEKLINYRIESLKNYSSTLNEAISLIEIIESNLVTTNKDEIDSSNLINNVQASQRRIATIDALNRLGDLIFKLPYQLRIVLIVAKNHYGTIFWNKSVPTSERQKIKTEKLNAKSFDLALKIATENYIVNGEPRHDELSELLQ